MNKQNQLRVSELFYSVQGEGSTTGKPSIFLRLTGCNLMCGGRGTEKDGKLHNGATWRCDTIETWLQGEEFDVQKYAERLADDYRDQFEQGAQLVITGGEPLLQQKALVPFLRILKNQFPRRLLRVEVETNGTIMPKTEMAALVSQFNVSPKLSNSGMPWRTRIKDGPLELLKGLATYGNRAIFKFVITDKKDMNEMLGEYIETFNIPRDKVWLMPGCSTRQQYEEVAPLVAELCKRHGFNFSGRLQINLWNQTTGV